MTYRHESIDAVDLEPADVEAIKELEGPANIRLYTLESEDEPLHWSGVMTMDRSKTEALTESRETICVLEGAATVELDGTETFDVRAGDLVVIPKGTLCRWTMKEPVKMFFVLTP